MRGLLLLKPYRLCVRDCGISYSNKRTAIKRNQPNELTELPLMTCHIASALVWKRLGRAHHSANGLLVCWVCLIDGVVEDEIEEDVITSEDARCFTVALQVGKDALVLFIVRMSMRKSEVFVKSWKLAMYCRQRTPDQFCV